MYPCILTYCPLRPITETGRRLPAEPETLICGSMNACDSSTPSRGLEGTHKKMLTWSPNESLTYTKPKVINYSLLTPERLAYQSLTYFTGVTTVKHQHMYLDVEDISDNCLEVELRQLPLVLLEQGVEVGLGMPGGGEMSRPKQLLELHPCDLLILQCHRHHKIRDTPRDNPAEGWLENWKVSLEILIGPLNLPWIAMGFIYDHRFISVYQDGSSDIIICLYVAVGIHPLLKTTLPGPANISYCRRPANISHCPANISHYPANITRFTQICISFGRNPTRINISPTVAAIFIRVFNGAHNWQLELTTGDERYILIGHCVEAKHIMLIHRYGKISLQAGQSTILATIFPLIVIKYRIHGNTSRANTKCQQYNYDRLKILHDDTSYTILQTNNDSMIALLQRQFLECIVIIPTSQSLLHSDTVGRLKSSDA
ncbi:hypothetical protein MAR_009299 [Mya arenaria]|uniref:Uncharacterized protein n=1 Tax=Mya arenaria TaxID=6604 RepID=A0ABY7E6G2_MYAAR|nr:hypothetical protein MAR_009299 [Mya arenaria]